MTHRGPFQPPLFCDSVIIFSVPLLLFSSLPLYLSVSVYVCDFPSLSIINVLSGQFSHLILHSILK